MNRVAKLALYALYVVLVLSLAGCGDILEEDDDDDDDSDYPNEGSVSSPINITDRSPYNGTVSNSGSSYYYYAASSGDSIAVQVDGDDDIRLFLYDDSSFSSLLNSDETTNHSASVSADLTSDGMYIRISGDNTRSGSELQITTTLTEGTTLSTDVFNPTTITTGTTSSTFSVASGATGYFTFSHLTSTPWGVYVTSTTTAGATQLSLSAKYTQNGSQVNVSSEGVNYGNIAAIGFTSVATSSPTNVVAISNSSSSSSVSFTIQVHHGTAGGSAPGSAVNINTGSTTRIGAKQTAGCYKFTADGTTMTAKFTDLTMGVTVTWYNTDNTTELNSENKSISSGRTASVSLTGLTDNSAHAICVKPYGGNSSSAPVVGNLTIN